MTGPSSQSSAPARRHSAGASAQSPSSRPARVSSAIAMAAALLGVALLVTFTGQYLYGGVAVAGGGLLAVLTTLVESDRRLSTLMASVLVPPTAALVVLAVALPVGEATSLFSLLLFVNAAVVFAVFGAGTVLTGALGNKAVYRTAKVAGAVLVVPAAAAGILLLGEFGAVVELFSAASTTLAAVEQGIIAPSVAYPEVGGFLVLSGAAAWATAYCVRTLPIVQLTRRQNQAAVQDSIDWGTGIATKTAGVAVVVGSVVGVAELAGGAVFVLNVFPPAAVVGVVSNSPVFRLVLLWVSVLAVASAWTVQGVKWAARACARQTPQRIVRLSSGGAIAAAVGIAFAGSVITMLRPQVPPSLTPVVTTAVDTASPQIVTLGVIAGAIAAFVCLLSGLSVLGGMGVFSDRVAPGAVAGGALLVGALFAGPLPGPPLLVFAVVVLAIVTWDVSAYGATMVSELHVGVATARPEIVHATASVIVGVVAIGIVVVASVVDVAAPPGARVVVSVLAAAFGAVFLAGILRG